MGKNDSRGFSYYFDRFVAGLYPFEDKELCMREYIIYMLCRTQKMFEYKGLPETIPARMLEYQLQLNGFACFAEDGGKLYAFYGGLGGEPDEYYRPTKCVVSNPALKLSKTYTINEDCVIVRNDSYLRGLLPLFRRYATAMVENDISFRMASINTRIEFLLSAPDDGTKAAAEKFLEDVEAGKLGVIASNEFLDGVKAQEVGRTMRTFTDLIEYQQYLKASWFNEIGLNANYNMKREKLSTTESQMNSDALLPLVDDMLQQRQQCLEKVNAMFGTNISVDFASSWEKLLQEFESNQLDEESEMSDDAGRGMVDESGTTDTDVEVGESEASGEENAERTSESASVSDTAEALERQQEVETADVSVEVDVQVNVSDESNQVDDESEVSDNAAERQDEADDSIRKDDDE